MKKDLDRKGKVSADIMETVGNLYKVYNARLRAECIKIGVHSSYRQIISYLAKEDGVPQLELVRLTNFKAPTISITLQKMENEGYVLRKPDLFDQRCVRVYLTDKGREFNNKMDKKVREIEAEIAANLTVEELEDCFGSLEKLFLELLKQS